MNVTRSAQTEEVRTISSSGIKVDSNVAILTAARHAALKGFRTETFVQYLVEAMKLVHVGGNITAQDIRVHVGH